MTKSLKKVLLLPLIIFNIIIFTPSVQADTIKIAADKWYPYNGIPDSDNPGYFIEILELIFNEAGHDIEYDIIPWTRSIKKTREGKYNAVIGAFINEVPDFIFPEEELGLSEVSFFTKTGNKWKYSGMESLKNINIGAACDYSYGKEIDAFFEKNPDIVEYVSGNDPGYSNLKKLMSDRIDVIIADPNVLLHKADEMEITSNIRYAGSTINKEKIYIAFSPGLESSRIYADHFSSGIKKLKENGKLDKVLKKYKLTYWK